MHTVPDLLPLVSRPLALCSEIKHNGAITRKRTEQPQGLKVASQMMRPVTRPYMSEGIAHVIPQKLSV